jgi:hypothetical protein
MSAEGFYYNLNLRWLITEAIHCANNNLGAIQYAVYSLQSTAPGNVELEDIEAVQSNSREAGGTLQTLFHLVNPLHDSSVNINFSDIRGMICSLLARRIRSSHSQVLEEENDWPMAFSEAMKITQVFFTYLWIRLDQEESLGKIRLCGNEQKKRFEIYDEGGPCRDLLEDTGRKLPENENQVTGIERGEFARMCLIGMLKNADSGIEWFDGGNHFRFCLLN